MGVVSNAPSVMRRASPGSATRSMSSTRTTAVRMVPLTRTRRRSNRRRSVSTVGRDRRTPSYFGGADVEPDLEVEPLAPVGINPGFDRLGQPAEELVLRPRVGQGQDDRIAGVRPQPAPVHEEGRLSDRPVAEEGGVLGLALAGPRDAP